jgi:hypothetical protein
MQRWASASDEVDRIRGVYGRIIVRDVGFRVRQIAPEWNGERLRSSL